MQLPYIRELGSGPDLVMLHGWGMDSGVWSLLLPELSERFHLTLVDLPGHGQSAGWFPDSIQEMTELLSHVAPKQAVWLGWSLGGMLATAFAARFPSRVSALVLVAANPRFVANDGWPAAMLPKVFARFVAGFGLDAVATLRRFVALQFVGTNAPRTMIRQLQSAVAEERISVSGLYKGLNFLGSLDVRNEYKYLQCPILSILGGCDRLVPAEVGGYMQRMNVHTALELYPHAGHLPFMTHPEKFLNSLESFLND